MSNRSKMRDFNKLQRTIHSFSNGEAKILSFDDELTKFEVELNIKDGLYKDGIFTFEVEFVDNYPIHSPSVRFTSQILHPNIGDGYDSGVVCLNLLSDDWHANDLEDVVQGMLFLVKNPSLDDALNPLFCDIEETNINRMLIVLEHFPNLYDDLEGMEIEGVKFRRNPGLLLKDKIACSLDTEKNNLNSTLNSHAD
ncbi:nedd8-conjugating enzyme UbcE2M-like [Xenia sp. Carnegie-2017]|uniref:nedd8-conjugating enzyme UbcE2M-like n=1 Tax=Xenia sp. Carnegie-2017 TaxID=2897299 RepID=UPI001F041D58|nr:nedd8-conjugating enzyme UbcE2M-like [Xenia sp. Carnegie-2017]